MYIMYKINESRGTEKLLITHVLRHVWLLKKEMKTYQQQ